MKKPPVASGSKASKEPCGRKGRHLQCDDAPNDRCTDIPCPRCAEVVGRCGQVRLYRLCRAALDWRSSRQHYVVGLLSLLLFVSLLGSLLAAGSLLVSLLASL